MYARIFRSPCCWLMQKRWSLMEFDPRSVTIGHRRASAKVSSPTIEKPSLWRRVFVRPDFLGLSRYRKKVIGYKLYIGCTDKINHEEFFKHFNLCDTFNSWFLITELHVWMVLVRVMQDSSNGRHLRSDIVEAMWKDVEERSKALGHSDATSRKLQIKEISDQFHACLFSYDEGLLSNDITLASSLWRRFELTSDDAVKLELLVSYVRRAIDRLDSIDGDSLLNGVELNWPRLVDSS